MSPPIALTIAGSDSSGGAGIQADLKTFSALGVYGASVITALTAQNTRGVTAVHDVPADFVSAQLTAVFGDLSVRAVKIGMLSQVPVIEAVAAALDAYTPDVVVLDPVMVAQSGDPLLNPNAVDALRSRLVPRATVITPNQPEAGVLLDRPAPETETEMGEAAEALLQAGARAVLLKGGHGSGPEAVDLLADANRRLRYRASRVDTRNTHGTGCSLSSAIAALMAHGAPLREAVDVAKQWLTAALRAADDLDVGAGHGPVHHFHAMWRND